MVSSGQIKQSRSRLIALAVLLLLVILGAIPGYLSGQWDWADIPQLQALPQLQQVRKQGLELSEWKTLATKPIKIQGQPWLVQTVERDGQKAIVMLFPQDYYKDRPQVEWMDLNGFQRWKTDSYQRLPLIVELADGQSRPVKIQTRFFRGWTQKVNNLATLLWSSCTSDELCQFYQRQRLKQTYAVMEWYAWPNGGSPSPSHWFMADRQAQLSGERAPWVANCILIPIKPLGNIKEAESVAQSLGQDVQRALMVQAFGLGKLDGSSEDEELEMGHLK
ncbi:MAG: cyanoexosortase B system-associated protein [Microcoleaceae cyanobacterium]